MSDIPVTVNVYRADGVKSDSIIFINLELPPYARGELNVEEANARHLADGRLIEEALISSLPGGTYDALLVKMLDRKRTQFRVTHQIREDS